MHISGKLICYKALIYVYNNPITVQFDYLPDGGSLRKSTGKVIFPGLSTLMLINADDPTVRISKASCLIKQPGCICIVTVGPGPVWRLHFSDRWDMSVLKISEGSKAIPDLWKNKCR